MVRDFYKAPRALGALALLASQPALAQSDRASNILDQYSAVTLLILAISILMALILFGVSLLGFKKHGENPNAVPLSQPIWGLVAATLLLGSGSFYGAVMTSTIDPDFSGQRSALALSEEALQQDTAGGLFGEYLPDGTAIAILGFVFLVGFYNFLKGIWLLKDLGGQKRPGDDSSWGKPLTHILGGVAAMNIVQVSCIVASIIGLQTICLR